MELPPGCYVQLRRPPAHYRHEGKLARRYTGVYRIVERLDGGAYTLETATGRPYRLPVDTSRLRVIGSQLAAGLSRHRRWGFAVKPQGPSVRLLAGGTDLLVDLKLVKKQSDSSAPGQPAFAGQGRSTSRSRRWMYVAAAVIALAAAAYYFLMPLLLIQHKK